MLKFILKRLFHMIPIFIIGTLIIFTILNAMPGDPVQAQLGMAKGMKAETIEMMKEKMGLNKPFHIQYFMYLGRILKGDFGISGVFKKPVIDVIGDFIWNTFVLNVFAIFFAVIISIPVGIKSGVKKYSLYDNFWTVFTFVFVSFPSFFLILLLIFVFGIHLKIFPISGMQEAIYAMKGYPNIFVMLRDRASHLFIPVFALTMLSLAGLIRYTRNAVIEVIKKDYIRTARSKGLAEKVIIYRHAFRNALIPVVTMFAGMIPALFSGSILTETTYNWPGLGRVTLIAMQNQDITLFSASLLFFIVLKLISNLLADITYGIVDPRIKIN